VSTETVRFIDRSRKVVATAEVAVRGDRFVGRIDLTPMPESLRKAFEGYEEIVNGQMFGLLDEIEEQISSIPLTVLFDERSEAAVVDLQVYPSTGRVSFGIGAESPQIPELRPHLGERLQDLESLRQNSLLDEGAFIRFAKDRGIALWGVVTGDPADLHERGWLMSDGASAKGKPLFHPFRIYPLYKALDNCKLNITPSASLRRDRVPGLVERALESLPSVEQIGEAARERNKVADLAIMLEPLYWGRITGRLSRPGGMSESDHEALLNQYRQKALDLVRTLDPELWQEAHEHLRYDAQRLDQNDELYLLLRFAKWDERDRIKGTVSGSLWLRHMAEVIRRAFEEAHNVRWLEEDQPPIPLKPHSRRLLFGSERPLDDESRSRPYLAWYYGLFTGSAVRWYMEGETEYYAILQVLPEPSKLGVELVHLRGNLATEKDNIALKLRDHLEADQKLRRFSMISFDGDVPNNVEAIRRQITEGRVVGSITAHTPDFEFANFSIEELVEIAARIDEEQNVSGDAVRTADWTGIASGRAFEERYKKVSARKPRGLKGKEWGEALAAYAVENPNRSDNNSERPFCRELQTALLGRFAHYDFQKDRFGFDPQTFETVEKVAGSHAEDGPVVAQAVAANGLP
jgi:hypothetical protein